MPTTLRATFLRERDRHDSTHHVATGPPDPRGLATRWECPTPFGLVRETWEDGPHRSTVSGDGIPLVQLSCDDPRHVVRTPDLRQAPQPLTLLVAGTAGTVSQSARTGPLWSPATLVRSFTRDGLEVHADVSGTGSWRMRAHGGGTARVRRDGVEVLSSDLAGTRLVLADTASPTDLAVALVLVLTLRYAIFPTQHLAG